MGRNARHALSHAVVNAPQRHGYGVQQAISVADAFQRHKIERSQSCSVASSSENTHINKRLRKSKTNEMDVRINVWRYWGQTGKYHTGVAGINYSVQMKVLQCFRVD